jgi:hypothetical protein
MILKSVSWCAGILFFFAIATDSWAGTIYDAAADFEQGFTTQNNPHGVWSYGYSSGFTSPLTLFNQTVQGGPDSPNEQLWLSSSVNIGDSPAVEFNNGPAFNDGNVTALADELLLVAGIGGQYSDLIFTAPADGMYSVVTSFRGDQYSIGTVVGVVANGTVLFSSSVTAEGQTVPFDTEVSLTAGNTVVFSVGPGGGLQNTGLSATITGGPPMGVVGNGTAASCTDAALNTALSTGGLVTFNCGPGAVTIDISPAGGGTGTKTISTDTTIDGGSLITISGRNSVGVFSVNSGVNFTVQNLTIANGNSAGNGGGIYSGSGTLTVTNSTFSGNNAAAGVGAGGGIYDLLGTLTVTNSTFSGNSAGSGAGGIYSGAGTLTVTNSTFSSNSGGGITNDGSTLTVTNSTFSGNSGGPGIHNYRTGMVTNSTFSGNGGGGIQNVGEVSTLTVTNSTFSGNSAGYGGGIYNNDGSTLTVTNSTFSGNSAPTGNGGGIYSGGGKLTVTNTIVANSTSGGNCAGGVTDGGYNIDDGTTCGFTGTGCTTTSGTSFCNTNPVLDPTGLQNNGGPTQTIALCTGPGAPSAGCAGTSPAINAGNESICSTTTGTAPVDNLDQRGFVRPGSGATNCSIGAYEANSGGAILLVQGSTDTSVYAPGSAMQLSATVTLNGAPVSDATVSAAYTAPDNSVQTVTLSNGGSGNVYTGSLSSVGTAQGSNGSVSFTASEGGQTATSVVNVTVTSHNLTFNGPQNFPSSLQQSASGLITVSIENDAYVADPATLQLLDVTDPGASVTLNQIGVQVPPRTTTASFGLPFNPASMSLGSHTLQVNLLNLPPGESATSVTQLSGTVQIVAAQPALTVTPEQPTVFTQAGAASPSPVVLTLANTGPDTTLTGITLALISLSGGTPYSWVTLTASTVPDLAFDASAQVTVNVQPLAGTIPNVYQDTAVQIDTTNGGSIQIPLTVYVDSGQHGSLIFAVSDDSHQAVANATVELLATVAGIASQTLTTDINGLATFTGVSAGVPFNYSVSAANHQTGIGSVTLQDASLTQTQPVVLVTQAILTTWTVVPTMIGDTYNINLQVTYQTDVPVPQLAIDPSLFAFTANPSDPSGPMLLNNSSVTSGNMTIYNPSSVTVNNVVVDASAVQGATVTLTFNGLTGSTVTIPSIPPQSNVVLQYSAGATCPSGTLASQINVGAQYTYFEITPALSASPSSFGPFAFGTDGISENLTISNTGYNIATNVTVSSPSNPWITVSQYLGDLGISNQATLPIVIHPPAGTPPDTYQEDLTISAGNDTPSNTLALTIVVNADGSGTVQGTYSQGNVPPSTATTSTGVPVMVYSCTAPAPPVSPPTVGPCGASNICIVYSGPPGGPSPILPPSVPPPPPPPVPMAHEIVQLEIPQTATLERQAFLATLNTTNTTSSELANFQVTINVTDLSGSATNAAGQPYGDLFAITAPQTSGYTSDGGIASGQTGTSQFTLIPSAGLGGTTAAGQQYNVAATYAYVLNGQPISETTAPVTITVYPQPQLIINYFVPQQVEANQPVKLGVIVQNIGYGPATDLVISSAQPVITNNASGLLVTFALLGAEVGGQPQVQHSLTLNLGSVPGGGTAYGYWLLNADLSGEYTAFTASYTEQPFAGVQLSPLIVGVHTNLIVQGDVVPAGGEDLQVVTQDPSLPPSILLDLETGVEIPVTTIYVTDATLATLASPVTTFTVAANGGYVVAVVPDALPSQPISSVQATYPDGSNAELFTGNNLVWRNVDAQGPEVNLVDLPKGSPGQTTTYAISYSLPSTAIPTPTNTPVPPTNTPVPPTNTPIPPTNTPVPPTNTPVPPTRTVAGTAMPSATPTATYTPEPLVPPNSSVDSCEDTVAGNIKTLAVCTANCQTKEADYALRSRVFDEMPCEQGTDKPTSCRAAYDKAEAAVLARTTTVNKKKQPICPNCLGATAQNGLADSAMSVVEQLDGQIYCAGTTKFASGNPGFVPPDKNTGACEDTVSRNLRTLAGCITSCQKKEADAALRNNDSFHVQACEEGTGKPISCLAAYDKAQAAVLAKTATVNKQKVLICPSCLDAVAQGALADAMISFIDQSSDGQIYCAGTVPLP